jgi:hypothetical protein
MSIIIPANSAVSGGYEVDNSLRFNTASTDYLTRAASAFGTPTNRKKCTISFWCKRSSLTVQQAVMGVETTPAGGANEARLILRGDDTLELYDYQSGYKFRYITNRLFRDVSAWYHIVFSVDTTHPTGSARVNLYINGVAETSFSSTTDPAEDLDTFLNSGNYVQLGRQSTGNSYYGGYLSEYVFIDGSALAPTDFGEFNEDSGIWQPKSVSGLSFGTNGFYLEFGNSGALGTDSSGAGNTFTPVNLTSLDQSTDTCTNNFATLNSLVTYGTNQNALSEGNTTLTGISYHRPSPPTISVNSGKWYFEAKAFSGTATKWWIGLCDTEYDTNNQGAIGSTANYIWGYDNTTNAVNQRSQVIYGNDLRDGGGNIAISGIFSAGTIAVNDIYAMAVDLDNQKVWYSKNGVWNNGSGGESTTFNASTPDSTNIDAGRDYLIGIGGENSKWSINYGNGYFGTTAVSSAGTNASGIGIFEYDCPTGYTALSTKGLNL